MKCDKLNAYKGDVTIPVYGTIADAEVYLKKDVDEAIAELKDKCQMHNFFWEGCGFAKRGFKNSIAVSEAFDELEEENAELKKKLMPCLNGDCILTCEVVEKYGKENAELKKQIRRLKRALYKACANWAMNARMVEIEAEPWGETHESRLWAGVYDKCLKKVEEYK
jgi:uncharacterized protein YehS (DUF1456 family)